MSNLFDKAKDLVDQHEDKVDQGLDRAGDEVDERTGQKYSDHIDKGVRAAQERTGDNQP